MFRKNMRLQKSLESMTKFEKRAGVHLQQKRQEEWAECSEKERLRIRIDRAYLKNVFCNS